MNDDGTGIESGLDQRGLQVVINRPTSAPSLISIGARSIARRSGARGSTPPPIGPW